MNKEGLLLVIVALMVCVMTAGGYASDYQGNEEEESKSVFQKIGNFITGKYVVDGKPLKEKGVIQVMADQVNDMKLSGTSDAAVSEKRSAQEQ